MVKQREEHSQNPFVEGSSGDDDDDKGGCHLCQCLLWLCPLYWIYQCLRKCCCSTSRVDDSEKGQSHDIHKRPTNSNKGYQYEDVTSTPGEKDPHTDQQPKPWENDDQSTEGEGGDADIVEGPSLQPSSQPPPQTSPQPPPQTSPQPSPQPPPQTSPQPSPEASPQPSPHPSPEASPQPSPQSSPQKYHPVVGLQNLGNKCFFDAALQAINQTDELHRLYVMVPYQRQPSFVTSWSYNDPKNNYQNLDAVPYTKKYSVTSKICDDPLNVTVKSLPGPLTSALQKTLWMISDEPSRFTPHELLYALGKCNPRFVRGTQEDSHEALRCLFDGIKTEELTKVKEKITNTFGPTNDGEDKLKLRGYLRMVSKLPTAIGQAIEGTIISTTICHECHEVTENFEPFFDISVPMPDDVSTEEENLRKVVAVKSTHVFLSHDSGGQRTTKPVSDMRKPQTGSSTAPQVTRLKESAPENIHKTEDDHDMSTITGPHVTETSYGQEEIAKKSQNQDVVNAASSKKVIPDNSSKSLDEPSTNTGIVNKGNTKHQDVINSGKQEMSSNLQGSEEINTDSDSDACEDTPTNQPNKNKLSTDLDTITVEQSSLEDNPVEAQHDPVQKLSVESKNAKSDEDILKEKEEKHNSQEDALSNSSDNNNGTPSESGHDSPDNTTVPLELRAENPDTDIVIGDKQENAQNKETGSNVDPKNPESVCEDPNSIPKQTGRKDSKNSSMEGDENPTISDAPVSTTQQNHSGSSTIPDVQQPAVNSDTNSTEAEKHADESEQQAITDDAAAVITETNQPKVVEQKKEDSLASLQTTSGSTAAKVNIVYREHRIVPVSSTAQSKKKIHDKTGLQNKLEDDANATEPDDVQREHRIVPISTDQSKEKRNDEVGLQKKLEVDANATKADEHCPLATKTTHNRNAFQQYLKGNDFHYQAAETKVSPSKFSLESCLAMHTNLDVLNENNKFICQRCTEEKQKNGSCASDDVVLCQVSKQLTIHKLPPVLILHFKRFDLKGSTVTKDNRYISFPDVLNVAPYCTNECIKTYGDKDKKILFGLYAVVVHQGSSLHCGHYIAYVREQLINKPASHDQHHVEEWREYKADYGRDRRWYYASDTYTRECQYEDVRKCEAYMLFYELLPFDYGTTI